MNQNQMIFDLNFHYLWLVQKLAKEDFNKACTQFCMEPKLLQIIQALTIEELTLLSLEEKTIFSWDLSCDDLAKMFINSPLLPENKLITFKDKI